MFGAHIAHVILNWEEDKIMFRGTCILNVSGQNILKPLPKKYAIKFRLARLLTLILWAIAEGCLGFYNKIAKCLTSLNSFLLLLKSPHVQRGEEKEEEQV